MVYILTGISQLGDKIIIIYTASFYIFVYDVDINGFDLLYFELLVLNENINNINNINNVKLISGWSVIINHKYYKQWVIHYHFQTINKLNQKWLLKRW